MIKSAYLKKNNQKKLMFVKGEKDGHLFIIHP